MTELWEKRNCHLWSFTGSPEKTPPALLLNYSDSMLRATGSSFTTLVYICLGNGLKVFDAILLKINIYF